MYRCCEKETVWSCYSCKLIIPAFVAIIIMLFFFFFLTMIPFIFLIENNDTVDCISVWNEAKLTNWLVQFLFISSETSLVLAMSEQDISFWTANRSNCFSVEKGLYPEEIFSLIIRSSLLEQSLYRNGVLCSHTLLNKEDFECEDWYYKRAWPLLEYSG